MEIKDFILTSPNGTNFDISVSENGRLSATKTSIKPNILNENIVEGYLNDTLFYDEITCQEFRDNISNTDYYITYIPYKDKNGNIIKLKHGYPNDIYNYKDENGESGETARSFSNRYNATFVCNASIWDVQESNHTMLGVQIKDGVIQSPTKPADIQGNPTTYSLGITADNTLKFYDYTKVTATQMLKDGCQNVFTAYYPLIQNGVAVTDFSIYKQPYITDDKHPRLAIGQLANKDIIFLACEGRTANDEGMNFNDLIRIFKAKGVVNAYNLDGGGSTQMVVRNTNINKSIDGGGKVERKVGDFIYIEKETNNSQGATLSKDIGALNKKYQILERNIYDSNISFLSKLGNFNSKAIEVKDCNSISSGGIYSIRSSGLNIPSIDNNWIIFHVQILDTAALQIAIPNHASKGGKMLRRTNGSMDKWFDWRNI